MTALLADAQFRESMRDTARRAGVVAAVELLHGAVPGVVVAGPAGYAVVPAGPGQAGPFPAAVPGLRLVRSPRQPPNSRLYLAWLCCLGWLRLGAGLGLRDAALTHLGTRVVGGRPLLERQLVQGALADATVEHLAAQAALDVPAPHPELVLEVHRGLAAADRALLRLLGAGGYLVGGPGWQSYLCDVLVDVYLPGPEAGR